MAGWNIGATRQRAYARRGLLKLCREADEFTVRLVHSLIIEAQAYCNDRADQPWPTDSTPWAYKARCWLALEQRLIDEVINPRKLYQPRRPPGEDS